MYYEELVKIYSRLEKTAKRLEKVEIISEFLKNISKDETSMVVNLLQGKVYADWEELKLGVSEKIVLKIINQSTGIPQSKIEELWKKMGDLGKVSEKLIKEKHQRTLTSKKLTLDKVYKNLRRLSEFQGKGTVGRKVSLITELLTNASPDEARHIINTVIGDLRVGVAAGIIRDSVAKAFDRDVGEIEDNYNVSADYGKVAELCKEGRLELRLSPGKPVKLMLSIKVENINEAFEAVGKPAQCEFKIDGFRLQIHFDGRETKLFTRSMENVTKQFPDVVKTVTGNVKGQDFILDSEVVGHKDEIYLPFQNISQRIKRKYDIENTAKNFPVEVDIFDVVYHNGKNLMNSPLSERRKLLEKIVNQKSGKIILTRKIISGNEEEIERFYSEALQRGTEGLMLKNLEGAYKPGRYVNGWVKLKPVMEPLDLVITKAEWGEGKRSDWLSSFTVSCKKGEEFLEMGKVGSGVKEKNEGVKFSELTKELRRLIINDHGKTVEVKPKLIIEVSYEEIQKSPTYKSGFALRFPRILRVRSEKDVEEINTLSDVERIYSRQRYRK